MQKAIVEFSYNVEGKEFRIQCENSCPIASAKEAAFLFMRDLGLIQSAQDAAAQQAQVDGLPTTDLASDVCAPEINQTTSPEINPTE